MKLLNLIPEEERRKERIKKIKELSYVIVLIPLLVLGYMKYEIESIEKKIVQAHENILQANVLERNFNNIDAEIVNLNNTLNNLREESIPLNYFLLFLGDKIPKDIKIYSVISETLIKNNREQEDVEMSGSKINNQGNEVSNNGNESGNSEHYMDENNQKSRVVMEEIGNEFKVEIDNKNVIIRGSALSVKSIGDLIFYLEEMDYVERVDIKYIRDYYNGIENNKLFEIKVIVKYRE